MFYYKHFSRYWKYQIPNTQFFGHFQLQKRIHGNLKENDSLKIGISRGEIGLIEGLKWQIKTDDIKIPID